jgi:putative endonuclease
MDDPKEFGRKGEAIAEKHLRVSGYRILERNYRTPVGELDLVAMDGETLVFVEVKARRGTLFGAPEEAVGSHKRRQLERAALVYITRKRKENLPCRFDVVSVMAGPRSDARVEIIKDAFELAGGL